MRFLAIAVLFISTSALACPNLAGKYATCRSLTGSTDGSTDLVITQTITNRVTTFTMTSLDAQTHERTNETLRADGRPVVAVETDPDSGLRLELSTIVSCIGTKSVSVKMNAKIGEEQIAAMTSILYKTGNVLTIESTVNNFGTETKEKIVCE